MWGDGATAYYAADNVDTLNKRISHCLCVSKNRGILFVCGRGRGTRTIAQNTIEKAAEWGLK